MGCGIVAGSLVTDKGGKAQVLKVKFYLGEARGSGGWETVRLVGNRSTDKIRWYFWAC